MAIVEDGLHDISVVPVIAFAGGNHLHETQRKLASHFKLFPVLLLRQGVQLMQVFRLPIVIMLRVSAFLQAI